MQQLTMKHKFEAVSSAMCGLAAIILHWFFANRNTGRNVNACCYCFTSLNVPCIVIMWILEGPVVCVV